MKLTYITLFFFSIVLLRAANPSADNRPQEKLSYQSDHRNPRKSDKPSR